jgi:hypothetical protein
VEVNAGVPMPSSDIGVGNRASFSPDIIDDVHAQIVRARINMNGRVLCTIDLHLVSEVPVAEYSPTSSE